MRRHLLFSALAISLCAEAPLPLQAPIRSVRLHPDEAWVTRVGTLRVSGAGTHKLKLAQLPGDLTSEGMRVQVKGPEGTRLGEILVGPDRYTPPETPESKTLLAKLEGLHQRKSLLESHQKAAEKAGEFLEAAMALPRGGGNGSTQIALPTGSALTELNRALEARWGELATQAQPRSKELEKIDIEMKTLESDWQKLKGKLETNPNPRQVTVELVTPRSGEVELEISYRTAQARWKPTYEARLAPDAKNLELVLFAEVTQASGELWSGVQMELSNSHPSRVQEMPKFNGSPRIGWTPPPVPYRGGSATVEVIGTIPSADITTSKMSASFSPGILTTAAPYHPPEPQPLPVLEAPAASIEEAKGLAQTWKLEGPKDVPSDGDTHRFLVASRDTKPRLQIVVAPRLDSTPYQVVRFDAPSKLPMFPGAPILRSIGTMRMGQGSLSTPPPNQPFELSFGPYHGLRVALQRVSEQRPFRMTKIMETRQVQNGIVKNQVQEEIIANGEGRTWEVREIITLTNDSDLPLEVEVQDRVIQSIHESIKLAATPDTTPGAVLRSPLIQAWALQIPAKGTRDITTGLILKAPKEGDLTGLKELGLE